MNNADGDQIKADRGQFADSTNFRADINTSGRIGMRLISHLLKHSAAPSYLPLVPRCLS